MSWQTLLSRSCFTAEQLAPYVGADRKAIARLEQVTERYPLLINPYYLSLIDFTDPLDPIGLMAIPTPQELEVCGQEDTSGEAEHTIMAGLQHKYADTALILSTDRCAMYCRHCFRKRMVGGKNAETSEVIADICSYIAQHEEISNVLISGGDALLNTDEHLEEYLQGLAPLAHLDFIRFGSRIPATLPQRITEDPDLVATLCRWNRVKQLYIATQFNHPRELTGEAHEAIRLLLSCGIQVLNQAVLLRGVNDKPEVLAQLMRGLTSWGVRCYYVFQCRPVRGVGNQFQVPLVQGCDVVEEASRTLAGPASGFRYVMSHPTGKMEILGHLDNSLFLRYHHPKEQHRQGNLLRVEVRPNQTWLPEEF